MLTTSPVPLTAPEALGPVYRPGTAAAAAKADLCDSGRWRWVSRCTADGISTDITSGIPGSCCPPPPPSFEHTEDQQRVVRLLPAPDLFPAADHGGNVAVDDAASSGQQRLCCDTFSVIPPAAAFFSPRLHFKVTSAVSDETKQDKHRCRRANGFLSH